MLKRTFVRVIGVVISLMLCLGVVPMMTASASSGTTSDGFVYYINYPVDYGMPYAVIQGYTGDSTEIVIPSTIEGYSVKYIYGFEYCTTLTSVTVSASVETIGTDAFYGCSNLTSITLPESLTELQSGAFSGCSSLESIEIPYGVTEIASHTFYGCSNLTKVTLPFSVESIGDYAFYQCTNLASVNIPNGVESIGSRAFAYCSNLSSVTLPSTLTSLSDAFFCCSGLTSVTIPYGVTKIWEDTFSECYNLKTVTIPSSVTSINGNAFLHCTSMTAVNVSENNQSYTSVDGVLYSKDKTELVYYPSAKTDSSYTIPSGVTTIGYRAFNYGENLESVAISDSVNSIGEGAFRNCTKLTSVVIPDNASIGFAAFQKCTDLATVTIPSSVTSIGAWAFYDCTSLTDVYFLGTKTEWNNITSTLNSTNDCLMNANIHFIYDCAEVTGNSITLFGDIGVNFFMNIKDDVLADEDATVIFTYDGNVVEVPVSEGDETTNGYKYTCNIPAKDMITEVTCKVQTSEGESETYIYTVKEYAEVILANPETYGEEAVVLVKSMLNYGAATQTYFGYNTDSLANDTEYMTDEDRAVPKKDFSNLSFTLTEGTGEVKYYGTALSLKSEVGIKHYFILSDTVNTEELVVTVDGENAELKKNGELYELLIPDIAAHNLYKKYEVVVGDVSLSYCVMDYAKKAQEAGKQELLNVMFALDVYAQCAMEYNN